VVKVRFPSDAETKEILSNTSLTKSEISKHTVIIFIGTNSTISNAECLMDYLVGSLEEIEKLTDNNKQIEQVWFIKFFYGSLFYASESNPEIDLTLEIF